MTTVLNKPNSASDKPQSEPSPSLGGIPGALIGLGERICRYFLEFLETDFKRQQAPRRKITL